MSGLEVENSSSKHAGAAVEADSQSFPSGFVDLKSESAVGHRVHAVRSVLALVLDEECVFAGLQGGDIVAWSLDTYDLVLSVKAHEESVLGLYLSEDGALLFSSGGDSVVNVWSTSTFELLYSIYSHHDVGDLFTVVYSSELKTVYCGGQNTSLQWFNLLRDANHPTNPSHRAHKFFDSRGPGEIRPRARENAQARDAFYDGQTLTFKRDQHRLFAHNGYVYCMALVRGLLECKPGREVLLTGSGDGSVKVWELGLGADIAPTEILSLQNGNESVLSIAIDGPFLYCGLSGGAINVWNLDSRQIIKTITDHAGDIWAIDIKKGVIISGDADGVVKKFNSRFEEITSWTAHNGTLLASAAGLVGDRWIYATGGNDNSVAIWDLTEHSTDSHEIPAISNDELVNSLAQFVGFKTISARPKFSGECNQGAAFLRRHCIYLGAQTHIVTTGQKTNPIVLAKFPAVSTLSSDKTILFYGHYDVVGAESNQAKWNTDPFQLTSLNGFLYGRGVSDNKGPILAALYAAAELKQRKQLSCNVVFLIEGEEESGSQGFAETIQENKALIGPVDWILLANSYWLDDHIPCLTYGLRGVIHANLIITSSHPDLHSGIDGSSLLDEPLKDLTLLLGTLVGPKGKINIPGFHDLVLPLTPVEKQRYDAIAEALLPHHPEIEDVAAFTDSLMHRWREPSLTIHAVEIPGCRNSSTTISRKAKATLSLRLVPNQDADKVAEDLINYAQSQFAELDSENTLTVEITGKADPWLGDPDNELFGTLSRAVTDVWSASKESRKHDNYPIPVSLRRLSNGLSRTTSSDSLASSSNIERILASSSSAPKAKASQLKKSSYYLSQIPTSSTLTIELGDKNHDHQESSELNNEASSAKRIKPIYIREGGSIPTIRFLEKEFNAPAAHLPCGQASDNAHLSNERLRVENLYRSREIFKRAFRDLGGVSTNE
ncbi:hypothetical protein LOZ39_005216 [Ophidiomyces ophidiicola]|uniref:Uncharacterized protein n=1 Tax=Ophidiomyces ophidiicola TaxID=1387563 RepID=A0ACB8UQW6_9EURO|nr:uncharacterized protein LOZ57_006716 [Ophidiomyces ophidiicola]KAI1907391.1 hypothetical protein LOZ64_005888 [Ophidiomyces ophidiicola]KAI1936737.1 hypothetical protein LOZ57_006716 [Ophidiomyces ophidiicola]KAI1941645.1 hypothetical protein LOZ62_004709 [Ophidiomyces ophidiicola]KAI2001908.1 hypothetical protein LOZ50_005342 [Ophidiomyces ophidiicola]KAI2018148.1 hypothetical protein LOZ46_004030 [Ophidiomyces ophidiicola]